MKHTAITLVLCCTVACGLNASRAAAQLTLASEGKSTFAIVVPATAPATVQDAAAELQRDIEIATGVQLPLQKDDVAVATSVISLGHTKQAKAAGIESNTMADETFRIITKGGNLYILGTDTPNGGWTKNNGISTGTANGVYTFLEDYLGVRWLMPGEIGRDVPAHATLTLPTIDRTATPPFSWRRVTHLWDYADNTQLRNIMQWATHQKLGGATELDYDHNWWRAINDGKSSDVNTPEVKAIYDEHPDWFAMDAFGKRPYPTSHYAKWETTNSGLVRWFADKAISTLKASPRPRTFSLSPSDGRGWSQSPESKVLYDPIPTAAYDGQATPGQPGMSSLILKWYHDVAQIVAKEYPQGRLTGYLYADYIHPPTKIAMKLPNNFMPVIAPSANYGYRLYRKDTQDSFKTVMDSWAKVAPENWYYYDLPNQMLRQHDNEIGDGNFPGSTGIVTPAAPEILNTVFSTLHRTKIKGAYIYGVPSWSNGALANYLLAKMEWDPTLNAETLQHEWLHRAYGPQAGAEMEKFHRQLDEWTGEYFRKSIDSHTLLTMDMLKNIYAAHYADMETLFLAAKKQPMTDMQKQRLSLIENNLIVLQWRLRNAGYLPADGTSPLRRSNVEVIALLNEYSKDFPAFPGLVPGGYYTEPALPKWNVKLTQIPQTEQTQVSGLSAGMFLLYSANDGEIRITPRRVTHGAYFASYQLLDHEGTVITNGILNEGTPITWPVKGNTPYFLYIPPRKAVNYELEVENAAKAEGSLQDGTLTLSGKQSATYVFSVAGDSSIGTFENGTAVTIKKPYSGAAAKAVMGDAYMDTRVLCALDEGWKFSPDPTNDGLARGVTGTDFDDSAWKPISPLDWWQMQGFTDYHGVAWYRIKFMTPPLPETDRARVYFGAVDGNAVVYLNDKKITEHILGEGFKGWDAPFSNDVTHELKAGENILAVQVTSKTKDTASGIFKGVAIVAGTKK